MTDLPHSCIFSSVLCDGLLLFSWHNFSRILLTCVKRLSIFLSFAAFWIADAILVTVSSSSPLIPLCESGIPSSRKISFTAWTRWGTSQRKISLTTFSADENIALYRWETSLETIPLVTRILVWFSIELANFISSFELAISMQQSLKIDLHKFLISFSKYFIMSRSSWFRQRIEVASSLKCVICICPLSFILYSNK